MKSLLAHSTKLSISLRRRRRRRLRLELRSNELRVLRDLYRNPQDNKGDRWLCCASHLSMFVYRYEFYFNFILIDLGSATSTSSSEIARLIHCARFLAYTQPPPTTGGVYLQRNLNSLLLFFPFPFVFPLTCLVLSASFIVDF